MRTSNRPLAIRGFSYHGAPRAPVCSQYMNVNWLVESEVFLEYEDELADAITQTGRIVKRTPDLGLQYRWQDFPDLYRRLFPENACVVFHGSIGLASELSRDAPWRPTTFCSWENYDCHVYYCRLADYLLNSDYVILPFGELKRRQQFLFDAVGDGARLFVRPNSVRKSFTGQSATSATFDQDIEVMGFYDVPPEALVLVSAAKEITHEWRFVAADKQIVAGTQYKVDGNLVASPDTTPESRLLAEQVAAQDFQPDPVWTIDICRTASGEHRLLEIGSFSCSDLYACDKRAVVEAVSAVASRRWSCGL